MTTLPLYTTPVEPVTVFQAVVQPLPGAPIKPSALLEEPSKLVAVVAARAGAVSSGAAQRPARVAMGNRRAKRDVADCDMFGPSGSAESGWGCAPPARLKPGRVVRRIRGGRGRINPDIMGKCAGFGVCNASGIRLDHWAAWGTFRRGKGGGLLGRDVRRTCP